MTPDHPDSRSLGVRTDQAESVSPFVAPARFSRRTLLGALAATAVVAAIDSSPLGVWDAWANPPKLGEGVLLKSATPYSVVASSDLSDEVFAASGIVIAPNDQLLPFINPKNNMVEAIVVSGTTVSHLCRDLTVPSGWAYRQVVDVNTWSQVTAALATDGDDAYLLIAGYDGYGAAVIPTWLDDATTWHPANPIPGYWSGEKLRGAITNSGLAYFYDQDHDDRAQQVLLSAVTINKQSRYVIESLTGTVTYQNQPAMQDLILLLDDNWDQPDFGYVVFLSTDGALRACTQNGDPSQPIFFADGVTALLGAWAVPNGNGSTLQLAYQTTTGTQFSNGGTITSLTDQPEATSDDVAVWVLDGQYTVNLLDANGVLQIIRQDGPNQWEAPLPLTAGVPGSVQPGFTSVYGVATDPTESTLFAVGADESLSVLTLDPAGWTQTQIHIDDPSGTQVTAYRVKIRILDANGSAVPYGQAQISTDRPVGLWQDQGSLVVTPISPATVTADIYGNINVSMLGEEIDAPVLTVQALDGTGQPSGTPTTVAADTDVRNFLGGTAPLNNLGTLDDTGAALTGPGNPFTGLDPASAGGVATTMIAAIQAGTNTPPAAGAPRAYHLQIRGRTAKLTTSTNARAFDHLFPGPAHGELGSLLGDLKHIGHALRHAVVTIADAVVDVANKLVSLVVNIADKVIDLGKLAINDIRDAFHVVGGFFATLGADIKAGLAWLKRAVLGFFDDVATNADIIESWLGQAPALFTGQINQLENIVDTWLTTKNDKAQAELKNLAIQAGDTTFGTNQPSSGDGSTGSSSALDGLGKDLKLLFKIVNDSPGKWLSDKLYSYLPDDPGPDTTDVFDQTLDDLQSFFESIADAAAAVTNLIWDTFKDAANPDAAGSKGIDDFFTNLSTVVDDAFTAAEALADTVLDLVKAALAILDDYLTYTWSLASLNPVLKFVLDRLHVDSGIKIGHLLGLVVGFITTIVRDAQGKSGALPDSTDLRRALTASPPDAEDVRDLYGVAAICQGTWTFFDITGDVEKASSNGKPRPSQSSFVDYMDILFPVLQYLLTFPGSKGGPFWAGDPGDTTRADLLPVVGLTALLPPLLGITLQVSKKAKETPPSDIFVASLNMLAAGFNTGLAAKYGYVNADSDGAKALAVLASVFGNLSNVCSPFTTKAINDSLEDLPLVVKIGIDLLGGGGAATVVMIQSGTL